MPTLPARPQHSCLPLPVRQPGQLCRQHARAPVRTHATAQAELPPALEKMVSIFRMVPDSKLKYQQLLVYAKQLPPLPPEMHTEEHKVRGCVSQVWVVPTLRADGTIYWAADSDSALTKGLAAMLVQGLSGSSPEQIARLDPAWVSELSPQLNLTPSRTNGFLNMFNTMQKKALALLVSQGSKAQQQQQAVAQPSSQPDAAPSTAQQPESVTPGAAVTSQREYPISNSAAGSLQSTAAASPPPQQGGPIQTAMRCKLTEALQPQRLVIVDESSQHAGHAAMAGRAGASGESHFRVHVCSDAFEGMNTIKRHRLVYQALKEELAGPLHALSLVCRTPSEPSS